LTAECGLLVRKGLDFAGANRRDRATLRAGVGKVLDAVRGQSGEIHWLIGNPGPGEGAQNRTHQRNLLEDISYHGQLPRAFVHWLMGR
jgi:hypothetical protein